MLTNIVLVRHRRHQASASVGPEGTPREVRPCRGRLAKVSSSSQILDIHWYQVSREDASNIVRREWSLGYVMMSTHYQSRHVQLTRC